MPEQIRKGDRFVQHHPQARWPLFVEVIRVGKTGWVDIQCFTWAMTWTKRMPQGLAPLLNPDHEFHITRKDWTPADIEATAPRDA